MMGKIAVSIILLESNGTTDPSTEDWTDAEITKVLSEIQTTLDWLASQNPNASVSFVTETHLRVPTSYEPISRSSTEIHLWVSEIMNYLGYRNIGYVYQMHDYVNILRENLRTDWAFAIFIVNSNNDSDGVFADYSAEFAALGGPSIFMTYDNGMLGIDKMDLVCAHEIGHIFWADDEYFSKPTYSGYLNIVNIPHSGGIMDSFDRATWKLSGAPLGLTGTWGQVGWRDSNGNGIQDIVDTSQQVYFNLPTNVGNKLNFTGVAAVTSYQNKNPSSNNPNAWHYDTEKGWVYTPVNVTINKIQSVQFRIDNGTWLNATITPTTVHKLQKYPSTYIDKETFAIVNYTFLTPELASGQHSIEIRATNQWGISGYANTTAEVKPYLSTDLNQDGTVNIQDITIVAVAYGSKLGDQKWNLIADLDKSGQINIIDLTMVAKDYGKTV
jgi:hypothetical protein